MYDFLFLLIIVSMPVVFVAILDRLKPLKRAQSGPPTFTAQRSKLPRGSYVVTVRHRGGIDTRETSCVLPGYGGRVETAIPETISAGEEVSIVYTPSLADETPQHVSVEWTERKKRMSTLVAIS